MTQIEQIDFLAPALIDIPLLDKEMALAFAAGFRPECLSVEQQDLAQIYYAIYILYDRKRQIDQQGSGISTSAPPGVKAISEGDVRVEWGGETSESTMKALSDPSGYFARWQELNDICSYGSITASNWVPCDDYC